MSHQHATLEDTIYFGFVSNDTSGSGADGSSEAYDVRLGGGTAGAAPIHSAAPVLLTHSDYGPGCYEVAVPATAINGFASGNTYLVYTTLTADGQTPGSCLGSFTLGGAPADVTRWQGTVVATPDTAGHPKVTIKDGTGIGEIDLNSGAIVSVVTTTTNTDMLTAAAVNAEVDTALADIKLDHLVAVADSDDPVDDSIIAKLANSGATADWSAYVNTTDSLMALRDHMGAPDNGTLAADIILVRQDTTSIKSTVAGTATVCTEARLAELDAATAGKMANQVDEIRTDTGEIGTAGALLTDLGGMSTLMRAEVQSEVDDALVAQKLDHLVNVALPTDWPTDVTAGSVLDYIADDGTAVYNRTTDSLQAIADTGGGGPTSAQIADAVWDEDIVAAHGTADTAGLIVSELTKRAITFATAVIDGSALGQLVDDGTEVYDRLTDSLQVLADSGGGGPTAVQIADAVWDELSAEHVEVGKAGAQLWTDIDAILGDTAEIGAAGAGLTNINLPDQTMDITGDITGNLSGSVGSVSATASADVVSISGSTEAADNLEESAKAIIPGTAQAGTLTTTIMTTDLTGYEANELLGRQVIWQSGTAKGQQSDITASTAAGQLTYQIIVTAPVVGDTFVVV